MERTRDRPITSGQVSMFDALVFLGGQLGVGLLVLLQLNWSGGSYWSNQLICTATGVPRCTVYSYTDLSRLQ